MEQPPPPYSEVINYAVVPSSNSSPNYCWNCGNKLDATESYLNKCSKCSCILVRTQQLTTSAPPFPAAPAYPRNINLPPITKQPLSDLQQNPSPSINQSIIEQPVVVPLSHNTNAPRSVSDMFVRIGDRLIFDFEKVRCCPYDAVVGLDKDVKYNIPVELQSKGITSDQWHQWMSKLNSVQKKQPTVMGCLCMFCFPGLCAQSVLCAMFCPVSYHHPLSLLPCCYGDWYSGLIKWQENVNKTLNQQLMHAKLLTYKPFNGAPHSKLYAQRIAGKDHNYEMSFLAISLTKEESVKLVRESWDHGVHDKCTSGIGRCL